MNTLEMSAEISTACACAVCVQCGAYWLDFGQDCDECGANGLVSADSCAGCWEDSREWLDVFLSDWFESVGDPFQLQIVGRGINWDRQNIRAVVDSCDLFDALTINGDYRLKFWIEGDVLRVMRSSHDEPTGAAFEIRGLDKLASNGQRVELDSAGRFVDSENFYGYTARLTGAYICYTCGHVCECGEDD